MEIKRVERIVFDTVYVAKDGTEFKYEAECKKYEQSAKCAIKSAYDKIEYKEFCAESIRYYGWCADDTLRIIKIKNENELKLVNQYLESIGNSGRLGADAIGTTQLIFYYPEYEASQSLEGTPEEVKQKFCDDIDRLVKEFEESEEAK